MKNLLSAALFAALAISLGACMGDEPLNQECDITEARLEMDNPLDIFEQAHEAVWKELEYDSTVCFLARPDAQPREIALHLTLTPGATAYIDGQDTPFQNGTKVDFTDEKKHSFKVVSEDRQWTRRYTLYIGHKIPYEGHFTETFSNYAAEATGHYYVWKAEGAAAGWFTDGEWKNGNPGFRLSRSSAKPDEYPDTPVKGGGPDGSDCIKLETCDTGPFGQMVNMKLASGSLFNGVFDVSNALRDALKATQFASPFKYRPISVSAWLRYEPGLTFENREGQPQPGIVDEPDFYAVVYRNTTPQGQPVVIDGNDVLNSPAIVAIARLPHLYNPDGTDRLTGQPIHGVSGKWQKFTLTLDYREPLDPEVLRKNGYSLVISFASSWQGAYFKGAIGSKLWVDNVELTSSEK
ncbi:MAG: PCMD domain-containing protein [Bacteroidales bacterium]|nr:PCMD domain-containing protein [Candidatus Equimonas faecalis]